MPKRVLILNAHPDAAQPHFLHALADAYAEGATASGCEVRRIDLARLDFAWLKSQDEFEHGAVAPVIRAAQEDLLWAQHLVILHPLWLGMMPALLKAFLEQVLRPGFAHRVDGPRPMALLKGRSARIVITMGMPAPAYRWWFGAHGLKAMERSILRFCGIRPVRNTLVGMVESMSVERRAQWLAELRELGRRAA
ncbi:MAG: NAD(P)H-dependent oxidoreductase [Rhodanobacteraceae bacterium]|nr:NAD(P)H-dependent oxidoreductase [Rhodanobacteraceae bacterium]